MPTTHSQVREGEYGDVTIILFIKSYEAWLASPVGHICTLSGPIVIVVVVVQIAREEEGGERASRP